MLSTLLAKYCITIKVDNVNTSSQMACYFI